MTKLADVDENTTLIGTYSISTAEELAKLSEMTSKDLVAAGAEFVLANDIDLADWCENNKSNGGWVPIGSREHYFGDATFDGNGYVISNLYINREADNQGLFGYVYGGNIINLGIENASVSGRDEVGILVGYNEAHVTDNCYTTGSVVGDRCVGGIAGEQSNPIDNSCSSAYVSGNSFVGGVTGALDGGDMSFCYATGYISGKDYVGGIIGSLSDYTISNNFFLGQVSGNINTGGAVGQIDPNGGSDIIDTYYIKDSSGQSDTGKGDAVTSEELQTLMDAGTIPVYNIKQQNNTVGLQIGIDSSESSRITIETDFSLTDLDILRNVGRGNSTLLEIIDEKLAFVSEKQTEFGAAQNRLESALESISVSYENLVSSRSTIRDADVAEESSAYIRNQILQQAAATLLATANQTPSIALQLL